MSGAQSVLPKIKDYELIRPPIGEGGMATVYRAVRRPNGVFFEHAIKLIHSHLALSPAYRRWFEREARLGSLLCECNHIVKIQDYGEVDGQPFLVMELVRGPSLSVMLHALKVLGMPFPLPAALELIRQLLVGLQYAYSEAFMPPSASNPGVSVPLGMVHRDLKPANVLVDRQGNARITDFGVAYTAHLHAEGSTHELGSTTAGLDPRGTYRYMSPEQAEGGIALDNRSDLFAAGAILFELLTQSPFNDAPMTPQHAVMQQAVEADLSARLKRLIHQRRNQPDFDGLYQVLKSFNPMLTRMLARDRAERPESAQACLELLQGCAQQAGITFGAQDLTNLVRDLGHRILLDPNLRLEINQKCPVWPTVATVSELRVTSSPSFTVLPVQEHLDPVHMEEVSETKKVPLGAPITVPNATTPAASSVTITETAPMPIVEQPRQPELASTPVPAPLPESPRPPAVAPAPVPAPQPESPRPKPVEQKSAARSSKPLLLGALAGLGFCVAALAVYLLAPERGPEVSVTDSGVSSTGDAPSLRQEPGPAASVAPIQPSLTSPGLEVPPSPPPVHPPDEVRQRSNPRIPGSRVDVAQVEEPEPVKPEPVKPEPVKPEPVKPPEVRPKEEQIAAPPPKPEPVKSEPTKSEPTKSEPTKSEPTKSEPTKSEPVKPIPVSPAPTRVEASKPVKPPPEPPTQVASVPTLPSRPLPQLSMKELDQQREQEAGRKNWKQAIALGEEQLLRRAGSDVSVLVASYHQKDENHTRCKALLDSTLNTGALSPSVRLTAEMMRVQCHSALCRSKGTLGCSPQESVQSLQVFLQSVQLEDFRSGDQKKVRDALELCRKLAKDKDQCSLADGTTGQE